jgi:hypothetical protein
MTALLATGWSLLSDKLKAAILAIGGFLVGAIIAAAMVTFTYEGLRLPLIGQLINGRVATAVETAKAGLVARSEITALRTVLNEVDRQKRVAEAAAEVDRARAIEAKKETADALAKLDAAIAADNGSDGCAFSADDLRWLSQH